MCVSERGVRERSEREEREHREKKRGEREKGRWPIRKFYGRRVALKFNPLHVLIVGGRAVVPKLPVRGPLKIF